jgi:hypothetical protein
MSHQTPDYLNYVASINIVNAGSGYNSQIPPTITISGGGGTGATATASVFNGAIQTVNITNIGKNYTSVPTITVTNGGGSGAVLTAVLGFASGSPTEYEEKSSLNVKFSLPEFIQTDYNKFVSFIEKYFEYMDENNNPSNLLLNKKYNDIDELNDAELNKRANELAEGFPQLLQTDRKTLLKKIKDIFESKGSERSIKAYFKLLYNEEIDVYYPSKNILRASDGVWIQETSVRALSGYNNYEVLNLNGRVADIKYYETIGSVNFIRTIPITIPRVEKIATSFPQSYEIIIELPAGTTNIPGPGAQASASATVVDGVITGFTVITGGYDYTAAPEVEIYDSNGGEGATARAVVSNGAITSIVLSDSSYVNNVTVTDGGSGYTSAPTVIFDDPPIGGTTATGIAVLTGDAVSSVTITNRGSGYISNPEITFTGGGGVDAAATTSRRGGENYNSASTSISFNSTNIRTTIVERGASSEEVNIRAYLDRTLFSVTAGSYVGSNAGFSVGDVFFINESGDDAGAYAVSGYFLEDYTYTGGSNRAVIRVSSVDAYNVPSAWTIINPGENFINAQSTISISSKTGESLDITLVTKYLYNYDGKYKDDRGKLSDVNRIQDNYKFQSYSYIVKSSISQNKWVKRFKDLMHPAGMEVFGDLIIAHNINFAPFIEITTDGLDLHEFKTEDIVISNDDVINIVVQWVRAFTETSSASEISSFGVQKTLADVAGASSEFDQDEYVGPDYLPENYVGSGASKHVYKNLTETTTSLDILSPVLQYVRTFTDEITNSTDSIILALEMNRTLADSTNAATDVIIISAEPNFSESASIIDDYADIYVEGEYLPLNYVGPGVSKYIEKVLTDISIPSELLERVVDYNRVFTDTGAANEALSFNMSADLGNQIVVTDDFTYDIFIAHILSDSVHVDDADVISVSLDKEFIEDDVTHSEFVSINTEKGLVEAPTASESNVKTLQKPFTETGNIADSGVITIQDYSDPTYFGEDYVGAGYNF